MKTAMQIAIEEYKNDGVSFTDWFIDNYIMLFEKEKLQIMNAHCSGWQKGNFNENNDWLTYYNKTYNQNQITMNNFELKQGILDKMEIEGLIERIAKLEKKLALKELEVKKLTRELVSLSYEFYKD